MNHLIKGVRRASTIALSSAGLVSAAVFSSPALAVEPTQCISKIDIPGGGVGLKNNCDKEINVSFCVANAQSQWACKKNSSSAGRGTYPVKPNRHVSIFNYAAEGGGGIHYVACISPESPINWRLEQNSFVCR